MRTLIVALALGACAPEPMVVSDPPLEVEYGDAVAVSPAGMLQQEVVFHRCGADGTVVDLSKLGGTVKVMVRLQCRSGTQYFYFKPDRLTRWVRYGGE